ncbi:hypothetical protein ENBRE01_3312 [Enteropsectra breve]|nr:hypothetical protein ENBRE01_3312 [Enteropsectra breve]
MENLEDEIEYFGFLPITFTTELQEALEEALTEIINTAGNVPGKAQDAIQGSLKKNIFIFNNFVLRNILKFPPKFKLERKITDKCIDGDAMQMANGLFEKQQRVHELVEEEKTLLRKLSKEKNRNNAYKSLLANNEKYMELIGAAKDIKMFLKETSEGCDTLAMSSSKKENEFDSLMVFKNLKSEYYKDQRDKLLKIASFDTLDYFNKRIV